MGGIAVRIEGEAEEAVPLRIEREDKGASDLYGHYIDS
jgi:hypothetical protein